MAENEKKEEVLEKVAEENTDAEDTSTADVPEEQTEEMTGESEETTEDAAEDRKEDGKKGFFKKKKDKKDEQIEDLTDQVKRQMAEFDNFRKRTDKEKNAMFETGAKSVIEKILPVVDNFERGLASIPEEEKGTPFAEGMEMIYKQLIGELKNTPTFPLDFKSAVRKFFSAIGPKIRPRIAGLVGIFTLPMSQPITPAINIVPTS